MFLLEFNELPAWTGFATQLWSMALVNFATCVIAGLARYVTYVDATYVREICWMPIHERNNFGCFENLLEVVVVGGVGSGGFWF